MFGPWEQKERRFMVKQTFSSGFRQGRYSCLRSVSRDASPGWEHPHQQHNNIPGASIRVQRPSTTPAGQC